MTHASRVIPIGSNYARLTESLPDGSTVVVILGAPDWGERHRFTLLPSSDVLSVNDCVITVTDGCPFINVLTPPSWSAQRLPLMAGDEQRAAEQKWAQF